MLLKLLNQAVSLLQCTNNHSFTLFLKKSSIKVVHKRAHFPTQPSLCPQVSAIHQPLVESAFSIMHSQWSDSWCSQNMLHFDLSIRAFYPYSMWADMWVL